MKTSHRIMAQDMGYARRPVSLRLILTLTALTVFVIGGGIMVAINLTATTTPKPGRIVVDIKTLARIPTAATIK